MTMNMGKLIDACIEQPSARVITEDAVTGEQGGVSGADSYRGTYEDVALEPHRVTETCAAGQLLTVLEDLMENGMEGYKGGDYKPNRYTTVWVSGYGICSQVQVVGFHQKPGVLVLITAEVN